MKLLQIPKLLAWLVGTSIVIGAGPHHSTPVPVFHHPHDVCGVVALLRLCRDDEAKYDIMLEIRRKLKSDEVWHEITTQDLSFATLPGTAELHAASWQNNDYLCFDTVGDVVAYERWGAIDPARLLETFPLERYREWEKYRWEARAMVLDTLSRRTGRVVRFVNVIDNKGVGIGHRKILSYAKEFSAGDAALTIPTSPSAIFLVGVNSIATGIINTAKAAFFSESQKRKTQVISGDPFRHSNDFAER